jgi:transposase
MNGDIVVMRQNELKRLELVKKAIDKQITQVEVSKFLGISYRQVKRIVKRVRELGVKGVIHQARGKDNIRKIKDVIKAKVLRVYARRYKDFGATLASEKLAKNEGIELSRETLRKWLRAEGHEAARRRRSKHRRWRERKEYSGQMLQMDGSHHDWLEGRRSKFVLMGYIDDASNRVFGRFYEYEGTIPAMDSFKRYCLKYGIPQSVYLDRHTTYKSPKQEQWKLQVLGQGDGLSEFERALKRLDVRVIHANSPQAKGRVERLFRTLQDRLVKELRLSKAKTIEQANQVLEKYLIEHNERYMVVPVKKANTHRSSPGVKVLNENLCIRKEHVLRNDNTVAHNSQLYQVLERTNVKKVEVREYVDGSLGIIGSNDRKLKYELIKQRPVVKKPVRVVVKGRLSKKYRVQWLMGSWGYRRRGYKLN